MNSSLFKIIIAVNILLVIGISNDLHAQKSINKNHPLFKEFIYEGEDQVYKNYPLNHGEFYNPILQGCYPDPSVTRKGDDYFLVTSSFSMFPGVPIFHSKDLVNWKQLGHVLDRKSQLKVTRSGVSEGIYAPAIRYNPYNDTFYMITTQFAEDINNMVVKTKDPFQGWSEINKLNFGGIDPSLFFDEDGKAYVVHNDAPDRGKELYEGHRVIKIWDYDLENDQVIAGTDKIIVDGGVDITQEPIWIEAPHIYKKNNLYYLMCAEGGTGDDHSEVIFTSDNPRGPYVPAENNPILSQRHLNQDRENKVDWAGHADLIEGPDGKYYGVFLAIRPNEENRVNIGRETFILPVDWSGKYPIFENGLVPIEPKQKMPEGVENKTGEQGYLPNGNFTFKDNFQSQQLDFRWIGMRGPREDFIQTNSSGIIITPFNVNIKDKAPTSTLFYRQQHNSFTATTSLEYEPQSQNDLAGIACYQSEKFYYLFGVTKINNENKLVLQRTENGLSRIIASSSINSDQPIFLQVTANGDKYRFNFSYNGNDFENLGGTVSGDILSTDIAGGFTGTLIGLHATTKNDTEVESYNAGLSKNTDFRPSAVNQQGKDFPQVSNDGRVRAQLFAPDANYVQLDIGGVKYNLNKDTNGLWSGESAPQDEGFHYYQLNIDGASVPDPGTKYFYGAGRWGSGIEIPAHDEEFYELKIVSHGMVSEVNYFSEITHAHRRCFVYTPPCYEMNSDKNYPVLYLQHGSFEDETGWVQQGKANIILDNLIADNKAVPMIIVMDNGYAFKPSADQNAQTPTRPAMAFEEVIMKEVIPMIDKRFRTINDRESRAIAGLSMGANQTMRIIMGNLDKFAYYGGFSGTANYPSSDEIDVNNFLGGVFKDGNKINEQIKVLWLGVGTKEEEVFPKSIEAFRNMLNKQGINHIYYESNETAHEWQTWRRSLYQYAQLLFK